MSVDWKVRHDMIDVTLVQLRCGQCGREVNDGPFRFCWRCRKIDMKLVKNGGGS